MSKPITCKACFHKFTLKGKVKIAWEEAKFVCPKCLESFCPMPDSDRELMRLQDQYFESNFQPEPLVKMHAILSSYAQSLIKKWFRSSLLHLHTEEERKEFLAYHGYESANFYLESAYLDPDTSKRWKTTTSFGKFLYYKVRQSLFSKCEYEIGDVSIDMENREGDPVFQLSDSNSSVQKVKEQHHREDLVQYFRSLLGQIRNYCPNPKVDYLRSLGVYLKVHHGDDAADELFKHYDKVAKFYYFTSTEILKDQIACFSST